MEVTLSPKKRKKVSKKKVLLIIVSVIALLTLIMFSAIPPLVMKDMINLHVDFEVYAAEDYGVKADPLTLETEDHFSIAAWKVEQEQEQPKGIVILLSGIHNPSVTAFFGYSKMLEENGYDSLLIELRSHGASEGDKIYLGTTEYLDVEAGVEYIKSQEKYKDTPIIVWGTSMGGTTAINAIGEIPEIDGLISFSAFSSGTDVFIDNMINMGAPSWFAKIERPFVWMYLGLEFGFDKMKINPVNEIQKLNDRPALLLHSTEDSQVPYASFERIKEKAPDTTETFVREGDYHFIFDEENFDNPTKDTEVSTVIIDFLQKNFK
ncbi:alpha/beta hydrolase [Paenibacillus anaericanus]|uniref:Alpha/beta hydrolase n=1 Tax=Paenibacillus anaericanus TaxID=170367 RepID=A0A3S1DNV1_9BACL|nr:alpha/beta fold hydrolase [Paenibacillus anaericanus]RUT48679.1 alpha/beta hydrolase [Paenibacillus anaericanus]